MGANNSTMLWDGLQNRALGGGLSAACDNALNTVINCPATEVQYLSYGMQSVQWSNTQLSSLCTSDCSAGLATLLSNVQANCSLNGGQMTWAQQVQYMQYKLGLVCLKDTPTNTFCVDVERGWNIGTLDATRAATWPKNTAKCYPNFSQDSIDATQDTDGSCIDTFKASVFENNDAGFTASGQAQAADFSAARNAPVANDNFGWSHPLEADEYPLEIQCSSCFV